MPEGFRCATCVQGDFRSSADWDDFAGADSPAAPTAAAATADTNGASWANFEAAPSKPKAAADPVAVSVYRRRTVPVPREPWAILLLTACQFAASVRQREVLESACMTCSQWTAHQRLQRRPSRQRLHQLIHSATSVLLPLLQLHPLLLPPHLAPRSEDVLFGF